MSTDGRRALTGATVTVRDGATIALEGVLAGVEDSRGSTGRAVDTVQVVLTATQEVQRSFLQVEAAVSESEANSGSSA